MTLRGRLALIAAGAVSIAVVAVALTAWLLARAVLLAEVDDRLTAQARLTAGVVAEVQQGQRPQPGLLSSIQPIRIGVQMVTRDGRTTAPVVGAAITLPPDEELGDILAGRRDSAIRTAPVAGRNWRVASLRLPDGSVLQVARDLEEFDRTLTRLGFQVGLLALVGVLLAGAAGWTVARTGLRPVDRLTSGAERVARTHDLAARIEVSGHDEVARLGRAVNSMLEALDDAHRRQQALVEDAAHELRSPLTVVRTNLDLLTRSEGTGRALPAADRDELVADLKGAAADLGTLIAEIVELARGDTLDEEPVEVDVRELVERAARRAAHDGPQIPVRITGAGGQVTVPVSTLDRALTNLIRNAVQVSRPGHHVNVDLRRGADRVTVRVSDRGVGVDPDERDRIFDRFYRGTGSRHRQGSGLGLAIVTQAAARLGGGVGVVDRPGGGAVFSLWIPVSGPTGPSAPPPSVKNALRLR